jgi:metallo-beta-lactamase family protein
MKLTIWGAAKTVTGSMHELALNGNKYLLECGLYQGHRKEARERNANFPFSPASIDAVMLSHAHIDHTGNLPTLVKAGYEGPVLANAATTDLCGAMLRDSAYLQEKDAQFLTKRKQRRRSLGQEDASDVVEPLYSIADAEAALKLFKPFPQGKEREVGPGLTCRTYDAGHMLGSTAMYFNIEEKGRKLSLIFSGDVGRRSLPITRDPEDLPPADYLIMESTYGDRLHKELESVEGKLAEAITRACRRGGKMVVPAFAVGRTQALILLIHKLIHDGRIPEFNIYVDSPLAITATEAFRRHSDLYDHETLEFLNNGEDPFFDCPRIRYLREVTESKALNDLRGPFMVISASGMCEAGRVLHHLRNTIEDPRNMVIITGFQAEHTLGRKIVDKWPEVPVFGEPLRLRAEVVKLNELSGHADQNELLAWMRPVTPGLKRVFLVHGEVSQSAALAKAIESIYRIPVTIPDRGQHFSL